MNNMEKAANEFLKKSGELYEINKRKWKKIIKDIGYSFSEDIYNDSILKTYDAIIKKQIDTTDYLGYWYQTFINNTKRDEKYARNQLIDEVDVYDYLEEKEYEENKVTLYYSTISSILLEIHKHFNRKTFETFRLHLLCNMSYEEIDKLTGIKDSKQRISKVKKWVHDNKKIFDY
jgi:DNA-directed RNA polymerase specialized sigma24 family protein